jgi:hypothetical protein
VLFPGAKHARVRVRLRPDFALEPLINRPVKSGTSPVPAGALCSARVSGDDSAAAFGVAVSHLGEAGEVGSPAPLRSRLVAQWWPKRPRGIRSTKGSAARGRHQNVAICRPLSSIVA